MLSRLAVKSRVCRTSVEDLCSFGWAFCVDLSLLVVAGGNLDFLVVGDVDTDLSLSGVDLAPSG